ncbi:MAG TPA: DUF3300 domain-containing protein [Candidatus Binatia bacterium]|nr:DUF3300 domain-containing protein [Candidatus Binatia bacterium]
MKVVSRKLFSWTLILLLVIPGAPLNAAESTEQTFKPEEIDALVAPIALYPDDLLSQIFMASTYPLEVVEASRWAKQNQNLKGDALAQALEKQDWDPSVRSLVNFPDVLSKMSDKLDWTQKLGDAFLSQQKDVLDAVQRLRAKAQAAGNLETTEQQKVIVEEKVIKIESPNPQVVYVPTYNPTVVYGAWPYPAYPPYPWYPPGYAFGASMLAFGTGVALGAAWGYAWGGCNWGRGDVDVDINRNTNFNRNINREQYKQNFQARGQREGGSFQHDPSHRKGVGYRDNATAQKFNRGGDAQAIKAREDFRGRADSGRQELARQGGPGDRGGLGDKGGLGQKGGIGDRGGPGEKGGLGDRGGQGLGAGGGAGGRGGFGGQGGGGASAFQGTGRGGDVRSASSRGAASRGGSVSRGGGGGARAGGGGGRGGGGRRR